MVEMMLNLEDKRYISFGQHYCWRCVFLMYDTVDEFTFLFFLSVPKIYFELLLGNMNIRKLVLPDTCWRKAHLNIQQVSEFTFRIQS